MTHLYMPTIYLRTLKQRVVFSLHILSFYDCYARNIIAKHLLYTDFNVTTCVVTLLLTKQQTSRRNSSI